MRFVNDKSRDAYEKVVDRLLASPRYGERMAAQWLDAARYADTNGYQTDAERYMWRWRDWVIDAFNRNLPFDQFTLAADCRRHAARARRSIRGSRLASIATIAATAKAASSQKNTPSNTSSIVWRPRPRYCMGLTLGCARCHDHKYDPFTQKEFYQLFAYFNNIPERGKANKYGNSAPMIQAPTVAQQAQLAGIDRELAAAEKRFESLRTESAGAQRSWEAGLDKSVPLHWSIPQDLVGYFPLDGNLMNPVAAQPSAPAVPAYGAADAPAARTNRSSSSFRTGRRNLLQAVSARPPASTASGSSLAATSGTSAFRASSRSRRGSTQRPPRAPSSRARRTPRRIPATDCI